jgi:hypothetical protein
MESVINFLPSIEDLQHEDPDFVLFYTKPMTNDLCLSVMRESIFRRRKDRKLMFPDIQLVYQDPGYNLAFIKDVDFDYLFPDHNEIALKIIQDYGLSNIHRSHIAAYTTYQGNNVVVYVDIKELLNSYLLDLGFSLIHQWSKSNITCWINDDEEIEVSYYSNIISLSTPDEDKDTWKDIVYLNHSWYRGSQGIDYIPETMPKARSFVKQYPL